MMGSQRVAEHEWAEMEMEQEQPREWPEEHENHTLQ
jgi:hypothetical protein